MFLIPIDRNSCGSKIISGFRIKTGWQTSWRPSSPSHGISGFWSNRFVSLICRNRKHTQNCRLSLYFLFWECYCRSTKKNYRSPDTYVQAYAKTSLGYHPTKGFMALNLVATFHPLLSVSNAWKACAAATCTCTGSIVNALEILTMRAQAYRLKQLRVG